MTRQQIIKQATGIQSLVNPSSLLRVALCVAIPTAFVALSYLMLIAVKVACFGLYCLLTF